MNIILDDLPEAIVSIHASTREATRLVLHLAFKQLCFNPRLHEGGDTKLQRARLLRLMFQSTPPRGRRRQLDGLLDATGLLVSIHASTREATQPANQFAVVELFQSTPPRGRRLRAYIQAMQVELFQSTPPRGRRRFLMKGSTKFYLFQSTPPRGRRPCIVPVRICLGLFQSTPPRGRRPL